MLTIICNTNNCKQKTGVNKFDLYTNKLIDYVTECSGNGYYLFQKPSDYKDFMGRKDQGGILRIR